MRPASRRPAPVLALALLGCHAEPTQTVVGRHAIIHWTPETRQLCGGTLDYVDGSLAAVAEVYAVELPARPAVEIVWGDERLSSGLCAATDNPGCSAPFPNGVNLIVADDVTNPHELTHAIRLTGTSHGMPAFFGEGLAVRWEPGPARTPWDKGHAPIERPDLDQVRAWLEQRGLDDEAYPYAGLFWAWLEAEFEPAAMTAFARELRRFSSAADVEAAFERSFGLTLDAAIAAANDSPLLVFDPHACLMPGLDTLTWTGEPLALSGGAGDCASEDVINVDDRAMRVTRLELPAEPRGYTLHLDAAPGEERDTLLRLDACLGQPRPYSSEIAVGGSTGALYRTLAGSYVVYQVTALAADGSVDFGEAWIE